MAFQYVNTGAQPNDGTGTVNRSSWEVVNGNTTETINQLARRATIESVNGKASQEDVDQLRETVDGKASQQSVNDLQTGLSNLSVTVSTKASETALNALAETVDTKASQEDLTVLTQRVDDLANTGVDVEALAGAGLKKDGEKLAVKTADTLTVDENGVGLAAAIQEQISQIQTKRAIVVGEFGLMPFRTANLPAGWYMRNGDKFLLSSPQGQALNNLPENYKTDWGITITNEGGFDYINVPSAFHTDGRAYFDRAVDGTNRQVGSVEGDAIRNITGTFSSFSYSAGQPSGAFTSTIATQNALAGGSTANYNDVRKTFSASSAGVPTAAENRVLNRGLTPVIFLGV